MLKQPWCGRRRRLEPAGQRRSSQLPLSSPRAPRAPLCRRWTLEKEIIGAFRTSLSAFVVPPGFHVFDFRMGGATLRLVNPDAKGPAAPELDHLVVMAIPSLHLNRAITPSGARHTCHRSHTHAHGGGGGEPAAPRAPRAPAATSDALRAPPSRPQASSAASRASSSSAAHSASRRRTSMASPPASPPPRCRHGAPTAPRMPPPLRSPTRSTPARRARRDGRRGPRQRRRRRRRGSLAPSGGGGRSSAPRVEIEIRAAAAVGGGWHERLLAAVLQFFGDQKGAFARCFSTMAASPPAASEAEKDAAAARIQKAFVGTKTAPAYGDLEA